MELNELYPSKFIKAADIPKTGAVFTIAKVEPVETDRGKEVQAVFEELPEKVMGLNKTNAGLIAGFLGSTNTDDWVGRRIALYRTRGKNPSGADVDVIRVDDRPGAAN